MAQSQGVKQVHRQQYLAAGLDGGFHMAPTIDADLHSV